MTVTIPSKKLDGLSARRGAFMSRLAALAGASLRGTTWCKLTQVRDCVPLQDIARQLHSHSARKLLRHLLERQPMSTEDKPEKPGEDETSKPAALYTPSERRWHRLARW